MLGSASLWDFRLFPSDPVSQPGVGGAVARGAATDMSARRVPAAQVSSLTRGKLHPRSTERRRGRRDPVVAQRGVEFYTANPV